MLDPVAEVAPQHTGDPGGSRASGTKMSDLS
jgi:hypothetical protein